MTVGCNCTPVNQLRRAAPRYGLDITKIRSPFDWFIIDLPGVHRAFDTQFTEFFSPKNTTIIGEDEVYWHVQDEHCNRSLHHFKKNSDDFSGWLEYRVGNMISVLNDHEAKVLFLRLEQPYAPDRIDHLESLAERLNYARSKITVASVGFAEKRISPRYSAILKSLVVEKSWPEEMDVNLIDWNEDYGYGPAWVGKDESWDRIWEQV